jgi:hypothetical protein
MKTRELLSLVEYDKENVLVYEQEYLDYIIYGDEEYEDANNLEYKITYLGLILGEINYRKNDITVPEANSKAVYHLWKDINSYVRDCNSQSVLYEKLYGTDLIHITILEKDVINE